MAQQYRQNRCKTLGSGYVDIRKPPPPCNLDSFSAYVALLCSKGYETIRLLGNFDDNLFTKHPLEDLRQEDLRVTKLTASTKAAFSLTDSPPQYNLCSSFTENAAAQIASSPNCAQLLMFVFGRPLCNSDLVKQGDPKEAGSPDSGPCLNV